jgi:hypothetical protein
VLAVAVVVFLALRETGKALQMLRKELKSVDTLLESEMIPRMGGRTVLLDAVVVVIGEEIQGM